MELTSIIEVIRIKQEIREEMVALEHAIIQSPDSARQIGSSFIGDDDREVFLVIILNTKNRVIGVHRAHVGSVNSSVVHPREVFKCAILNNASCLIVCHQHPSGDPTPSREDILVSERLHEAGDLIGIPVLDHLILGADESYVSMKQRGYMG
ncbi:DNA repair protein RadC [Exiguobacterium sp. s6]|uniref:JAB domain-containing protein n=1 Tax=Exiguobacterium sp. s6 TaxID=2751236 RepID=UPI001BEA9C89|nr:DNA repair protein RadC [Exiguobacterium sp. s6]